jgi:hypothetical protein
MTKKVKDNYQGKGNKNITEKQFNELNNLTFMSNEKKGIFIHVNSPLEGLETLGLDMKDEEPLRLAKRKINRSLDKIYSRLESEPIEIQIDRLKQLESFLGNASEGEFRNIKKGDEK